MIEDDATVGALFRPAAVRPSVTWGDLFEAASEYEVDGEAIRDALDRRRRSDA